MQVKKYVGTSVNAVKAQIWVALIAYLLMMAVKFQSKLGWGHTGHNGGFDGDAFCKQRIEKYLGRCVKGKMRQT